MQTFLPFADYNQSAQSLDYKRLGKQRSEALIILNGGWPHHPASKMWLGYSDSLVEYLRAICTEWIKRGYADTVLAKLPKINTPVHHTPSWLGWELFHQSHRSNLIRKFPEYYRDKLKWTDPDNLPYIWPKVTHAKATFTTSE